MVGQRKCAKCGLTSKEDPSVTFHRFPLPSVHGSLKAQVWAKFCFPDEDWTSDQSLYKLYNKHEMLCGRHFDSSSFTSSARKRLNKFAIPFEAQNILAELRENNDSAKHTQVTQMDTAVPSTSQCSSSEAALIENSPSDHPLIKIDTTVPASTSQCSTSVEVSMECKSPDKEVTEKSHSKKGGSTVMDEIGGKTVAELTPRKQKLYKRCRKNLSEILRLRRKLRKTKKRDRHLITSFQSDGAVQEIMKTKLSSSFYLLLQSQMQNTSRKLAGRRWTMDDKVLALSIYKKSSSCYKLLRKLFCLPSVTSLKALLNKIPMECGINDQILQTVKEITQKRSLEDYLCVLAFDEMSLRKNLTYNSKLDQIEGYQDHAGQGRTKEIASKALAFMAIGLRKNWKQPMAFYFSGPNVTADRLTAIIKEVLSACFTSGLQVVGTVCDCDGVNIRALNSLGSSTDRPYFEHEGHEIVTISDPPHLLKCFRNNFMKHNVQFTQELQLDGQKITGVAKWAHIEQFFDQEQSNPNFVFAPALTRQHLEPNGKQKMKVKLAAQMLSHSVAAGLYAKVAQNELPQEAISTAAVVSKMDTLFDAMNGDTPDRKRGKPLLTNMSSTSPHLNFFQEMKVFFAEMKFIGARSKPPSQAGWLRTLNAMERLLQNIKKLRIKALSPKRLNQDPLENCFGCIRSNCGSNPNPTTVQFVAALKTSIITNLINNNKNRNCLDDSNNLLNNLKKILDKGINIETITQQKTKEDNSSSIEKYIPNEELEETPQCSGEMQACAYVCGFIAKTADLECQACKTIFLTDQNTEVWHLFTSFKEYTEKESLKYVQASFCELVENAATQMNKYLKKNSHRENIQSNLKNICEQLNFDCLNLCTEHRDINKEKIIRDTIAICLKRFCVVKNRGFIEEASRQSLSRKINILKNV